MKYFLFIFSICFLFYFVLSPGETSYNYFTRLSQSFIQGKLYLNENPPWLNELVPINDKYYVVYPPMPAVILIPYILLIGSNSSQTIFSIFLGSINVGLVYLLCKKLNLSLKSSILITTFFGFGTNHWYLSSIGSAWFLAHIVALFFMLLALLESFGKKRLLIIGFLIGAAFWARTTIIFTLPFFYIYFHKELVPVNRKNILYFITLSLGIIFFILLDSLYNYLRFNTWSPLSPYNLIPNIDKDLFFRNGFMSLNFIPRHINAMFFSLPEFKNTFPFLIPSIYATAIWFSSPFLVFVFKAKRDLITFASWAAIIPTMFIISLWAGVGYAQFGYRFLQDVMPFLLLLVISAIGQKPSKWAYILVFLSIIVNLWGIILINKFDIFFI